MPTSVRVLILQAGSTIRGTRIPLVHHVRDLPVDVQFRGSADRVALSGIPPVVPVRTDKRQYPRDEPRCRGGEFAITRPTVLRALRVRGQAELTRDESREDGELVAAGTTAAPARIAALLDVKDGTELFFRRRLVRYKGQPSEIVTMWLLPDVVTGTGLDAADPVPGGIQNLFARTKGLRIDHVVEHVAARHPAAHETRLLDISRSAG